MNNLNNQTRLNRHLLDSILRLAITDTKFLTQIAGQVDPIILPDRMTARVMQICADYFASFGESPGDHFHDELFRSLADAGDDEKAEYAAYVQRIRDMRPPNAPYILARLNGFIKVRVRERAYEKCADLLLAGNMDEADAMMYDTLKCGVEALETGLEYLTDMSSLQDRNERASILMPTGIDALDRLIGGYQRGWLLVMVGGYKGMKSWSLQHIGVTALRQGLNVLLLTHELSQEQCELRIDMQLTGLGTQRIGQEVQYPIFNERSKELEYVKRTVQSIHKHTAKVAVVRKALAKLGGRLIIKKYPMGQCTFAETERLLSYLETFEGFVPDVLIQDYVDIMALTSTGQDTRHGLNEIYIRHKGLADEHNMLVVTASQVNTDGLQRYKIGQKHIAEDRRKIGNVDAAIAVCRTEEDENANIARLAVIAGRDVPQGQHCVISCCPTIGQFCLSSWMSSDFDEKGLYEYFGEVTS